MEIREVRLHEWKELRDIRLRALAEAPDAFGSTLEYERAQPEEFWRPRAWGGSSEHTTVVAVEKGRWLGLAGGLIGGPGLAHVVAMWVDPERRNEGIGRRLVEAVATWARAHGATELELWVTETNEPAVGLYRRTGFVATGAGKPLPSNPSLTEIAMRRPL